MEKVGRAIPKCQAYIRCPTNICRKERMKAGRERGREAMGEAPGIVTLRWLIAFDQWNSYVQGFGRKSREKQNSVYTTCYKWIRIEHLWELKTGSFFSPNFNTFFFFWQILVYGCELFNVCWLSESVNGMCLHDLPWSLISCPNVVILGVMSGIAGI